METGTEGVTVGVLGLGSWGTALAALLAGRVDVAGWTHDPSQRASLAADRENRKYLPGVPLPANLRIEETVSGVLAGCALVVFAVPSHAVREVATSAASYLPAGATVVNVAKGLEEGSLDRMSTILTELLPAETPVVSLLGPSHAEEVSRGQPTALVAASHNPEAARRTQELLNSETLRIYTSPDLVGVELAAGLKNIIAIAAGISVGLGYGDNTMGALVTRGLAEITRLGTKLGGRPETFSGLSGLGDLVTTCISPHSRNRWVGEQLGQGRSVDDVLGGMVGVAEGVRTTRAGVDLARRYDVDMPIATAVRGVLDGVKEPRQAIRELMLRDPKAELT
ncbi:MAG: NAD(P)H-dependent glycerol-3-phosphate dehydrogenase [Candidatus Eisenbacteria bacterium]|nr:NAD(P)H-dependent glycerol-3-phosphate dehydrogenase [Candidatus Eisenbacteria bacterium]